MSDASFVSCISLGLPSFVEAVRPQKDERHANLDAGGGGGRRRGGIPADESELEGRSIFCSSHSA